MWIRSGNADRNKPLDVEFSGDWVIVRRNYKLVAETEDIPEHWEYVEWQMTSDQYDVYKVMMNEFTLQENAILELADLIGGVL